MGDIADYYVDTCEDWDEDWLPRKGAGTYNIVNKYGNERRYIIVDYTDIIRESDKSWTLKLEDESVKHFSKKHCRLYDINSIIVPDWLYKKIFGEGL